MLNAILEWLEQINSGKESPKYIKVSINEIINLHK